METRVEGRAVSALSRGQDLPKGKVGGHHQDAERRLEEEAHLAGQVQGPLPSPRARGKQCLKDLVLELLFYLTCCPELDHLERGHRGPVVESHALGVGKGVGREPQTRSCPRSIELARTG